MTLIKFVVARQAQKVDGVEYKAGDDFDFDPANPLHKLLYDQRVIKPVRVEAAEKAAPASRKRSRSKS